MAPPVGLRRIGNVAAIGVAGGPKRENSPALFGGEEITAYFQKILGHSIKHGGLGIPDLRKSAESAYDTSKADRRKLLDSLLGGSVLNCVGHRACICKASQSGRLSERPFKLTEIFKRQEQAGGQERNRLHRAMRNGAYISAIPDHLNDMELSREEFRDNVSLRYGLMPQDIPVTCDGCGKKFSITCLKGGLVLACHDDATKEWGALGAWALVPSAITYKPKINSRTVQWDRTGAG